jgi:hypothetical protein
MDVVLENIQVLDNGTKTINFYMWQEYEGEILTSIADIDGCTVMIYPNPATETVNLEVPSGSTVQLFSHTGQLVYDKTNPGQSLQIGLHKFEAGIYLVRIISGNHIYNEKLIIR